MKKISVLLVLALAFNTVVAQNIRNLTEINLVKTTSVKNQKSAGTCWSFATVSFIETEVLKATNQEFDLSENYIVYYAYLNKARLYILKMGHHQFDQGGQAHDVLDVVKEYGIVPEANYPYNLSNHDEFYKEMKTYLDSILQLKDLPKNWENEFKQILNKNLGTPPTTVSYKGKEYSPKEFVKSVLEFNPNDYVELASFTAHPYYKPFILEVADNWSMASYYNVPMEDMMKIMNYALQNGYSVDWDGDVSEKEFKPQKGYAKWKFKGSDFADEHEQMFLGLKTTDDHLMHIVGLYKDKKDVLYYKTKNSWGIYGPFAGYIYMSENYVKLKNIAIMVNKKAIPNEIKEKLNI